MIRCFWAWLTILYIAHNEHENNFEEDFTGDVSTFLVSYFPSILDKYFYECQQCSLVMNSELLWDEISSRMWFISVIFSLIQTIDYV